MISRGGLALKSPRKRSTNTVSIAAASWRPRHGGRVMPDLMIARGGVGWRVFQPVERALASERRRSGLIRLEAAQQGPEHRVVPQVVVVDEVLVPKRQAEDALTHQAPHPMGDEGRMAPIAKARGEPVNEPDGLIRRAEQKSPDF